jgi:ribonucleoside-diphosphate reductase alpha chain
MPLPVNPPSGPVTLSANARTVLAKRYLVKDKTGQAVESPEDLFWRVATVVADADARYGATEEQVTAVAEEFYALMTQRRFEPNSPTLMNAGRPLGQLSACFVLPVEDALANGRNGIYDTLKSMAIIHQSGGGTGFSFSKLRGKGSMVRSTTGVASGPISFMKLYDASTDAVKQGGTRREHGHPARGPSRRDGLHHVQGRPHADHQLQHLRGRDDEVHGCPEGQGLL